MQEVLVLMKFGHWFGVIDLMYWRMVRDLAEQCLDKADIGQLLKLGHYLLTADMMSNTILRHIYERGIASDEKMSLEQ